MTSGQQFHLTHIEVYFGLAVFLLVAMMRATFRILDLLSRNIALLIILRWMFGHLHHGKRVTDATFWHHGTVTSRKHGIGGFMDNWEHKPGYQRMLWRWGCLFAVVGLIYGSATEWVVTSHALTALIVYGLACGGFVIESKIRLRVHNRHVINPIVKSLAPALRLSVHAVRRMLRIKPEDITDEGEVGYIELPPEITPGPDQQKDIERIIDAHLPVDVEVDWRLNQSPKIGVIRAGLRPPAEVTWAEMVPLMREAKYGDIYNGKNRWKQPYVSNFIHMDEAHWAACVQTKQGKSNWLGLVAVQVLHQDPNARVTVIDPKEESLIDFLGAPWSGPGLKPLLPGVVMANNPEDPEAMIKAVHDAKVMMDRRRSAYARDRTLKFSVHLVILDELNRFSEIVDPWWQAKLFANKRLPKEDQEDLPKACPVWSDIRALLHMGRFVGTHCIAVAQDFRADIIGSKGGRNGFGLRALGGFIPSQWKMFIGTTPVPAAQRGIGRWIFWHGEDQDWVQITHCDKEAAYEFAAEGRNAHDAMAALGYEPGAAELVDGRATHSDVPASLSQRATSAVTMDTRRVIVGMRAAAEYLGMKPRAFETAKRRTESDGTANKIPGEFMSGRNVAWYAADLDSWHRDYQAGKDTQSPAMEG